MSVIAVDKLRKLVTLLRKVEQKRFVSSYDIAKELNIHYQTELNHLKKADYKKEFDVKCRTN